MAFVIIPIACVDGRDRRIVKNEQILCVVLLGSLGEVERTRNYQVLIDDDDLVVGGRVTIVNERPNPGIGKKGGGRVFFRSLGTIENDRDANATLVRFDQCLSDRRGSEREGLDQNRVCRAAQGGNDRIRATAHRREIDLDSTGVRGRWLGQEGQSEGEEADHGGNQAIHRAIQGELRKSVKVACD